MAVYVIGVKGSSLIARVIQRASKSEYSHCAFIIDSLIYEADWFGVTTKFVAEYNWSYDKYKIKNIDPIQVKKLIRFCNSKLGVRYDYGKAIGLFIWAIFNWPWPDRLLNHRKALTCWEFVWDALKEIGLEMQCSYEHGYPGCIAHDPLFKLCE
jgi:hypothetical protein